MNRNVGITASGLVAAMLWTATVWGAKSDWAEGTARQTDGATRDYYNRAALLPWRNFLGDWRDANDAAQGPTPYAAARIVDTDTPRFISWDVTRLVRQWLAGRYANQGFFLRVTGGQGSVIFCSREHAERQQRPRLVIVGRRGSIELEPVADTCLEKSTYRSLGTRDTLRVAAGAANVLVRFDLSEAAKLRQVSKVTLRLFTTKQYGTVEVGVFRCQQGHDAPPSEPQVGLAARYANDAGIARDPAVVFATGFESPDWRRLWSFVNSPDAVDAVESDRQRRFEPLLGRALRVKIAQGANAALSMGYKFAKETGGPEPEEIYFRYYLRFGDDWNPTVQGGKLPGISGTYGVAGWGGRKVDGTDGWSARGWFGLAIPEDNPLGGLFPIGTYCYHADMKGWYGDVWPWTIGYRGFLEKNRWYSIEQYVKMNTPGKNDGVLRAWVDGQLAFEKTDIRFRDVDRLKIEQIWMNVYHGGRKPSPYDQHLFIDNVVIAKKYIGPMQR